jgi:hypothetical protein
VLFILRYEPNGTPQESMEAKKTEDGNEEKRKEAKRNQALGTRLYGNLSHKTGLSCNLSNAHTRCDRTCPTT